MRLLSFFLILGVAALLATDPRLVAAQNLADRAWRTLATPATVARIEQWEEWFVRTQGWVSAMNGAGQDGQPTAPFEAVPIGAPVFEIPARWAGQRLCRRVGANRQIVLRYDWFNCRLFKSDGQWRIEKTTGSVRFDAWLFRDEKFGTVALGDEWVDIERRSSRLGDGSTLSKVAFVLRYDGARMLRLFDPLPNSYGILEIDLRR
jgi:hypothetical protein